jgi:hypothetical protein
MSDEREPPRLPSDTEHRGGDGAEQQKPISREEMDTSECRRAKSVGTTSNCESHRRRPTSQSWPKLLSAQFPISPRRESSTEARPAEIGASRHQPRESRPLQQLRLVRGFAERSAIDNCEIYVPLMVHCGSGARCLAESVERELLLHFSAQSAFLPPKLAFVAITQAAAPIKPNNAEDLVTQISAGEKSSRDFRGCRSIRAKCECEERAMVGAAKGKTLQAKSLSFDA